MNTTDRRTYRLLTVNTTPERAKVIIGRVVEAVAGWEGFEWRLAYVGNVAGIEDVKAACEKEKPDLLFCASMWTPEESNRIQAIAKDAVPGIMTMALPQGLQAEKGPDGVFDYIIEKLPGFIGV